MTCEETRTLVHGLIDGELDLVTAMRVEEHLKDCPACASVCESYRNLRSAISPELYAKAPAALHDRITAALREAAPARPARAIHPWRGLAIAAMIAIVAGAVWAVVHFSTHPDSRRLLAQEAIASHIRSLQADHLTDVASSDQHTVKPWFNGKLDFSPAVVDLADQGFPLAGGRLDYLDGRPVAALVYRRGQHVINLFTWPNSGSDQPVASLSRQGYHVEHWAQAGMDYWAVSDVSEEDLRQFVKLVRERISAGPTTEPAKL